MSVVVYSCLKLSTAVCSFVWGDFCVGVGVPTVASRGNLETPLLIEDTRTATSYRLMSARKTDLQSHACLNLFVFFCCVHILCLCLCLWVCAFVLCVFLFVSLCVFAFVFFCCVYVLCFSLCLCSFCLCLCVVLVL